LTFDPVHRITIEEIKNREFFKVDLPPHYIFPRPVVTQCMNDPIDPAAVQPEIVNVLRKIGHTTDDELAADLQSTGQSMRKCSISC
jgi:hypothetical protein